MLKSSIINQSTTNFRIRPSLKNPPHLNILKLIKLGMNKQNYKA